jgi:hypothetical protein
MRRKWVWCLLALVFLAATGSSSGDEGHALATLGRLGAKVTRDEQRPGKPVVLVDSRSSDLTDADLKNLKSLQGLRTLRLDFSKVTDAGLKELATFRQLDTLGLSGTKVTDAGLKWLTGLGQLRTLLTAAQIRSSFLDHRITGWERLTLSLLTFRNGGGCGRWSWNNRAGISATSPPPWACARSP